MDSVGLCQQGSVGNEQEFTTAGPSALYPQVNRRSAYPETSSADQTSQIDKELAMNNPEYTPSWQFTEDTASARDELCMDDWHDIEEQSQRIDATNFGGGGPVSDTSAGSESDDPHHDTSWIEQQFGEYQATCQGQGKPLIKSSCNFS